MTDWSLSGHSRSLLCLYTSFHVVQYSSETVMMEAFNILPVCFWHVAGPATAKLRGPLQTVFVAGRTRSPRAADRISIGGWG